MKSVYFFLILLVSGFSLTIRADAQESRVVSGIVTSFRSIPLRNVTIKSLKAGHVVQTDSMGQFTIQCLNRDRLILSASGFDDNRFRTKKNSDQVKIDLVFSNEEKSFNLATSNNHISAEVLQEAIETLPMKGQKDYSMYTDIFDLIDNEIMNVNVNGRSVTTRKIHSIQMSSDVLFVIDEVIGRDISSVTPLNVKSIRFVDGVSASQYGAKGANGVIVITLKN